MRIIYPGARCAAMGRPSTTPTAGTLRGPHGDVLPYDADGLLLADTPSVAA
jgi:hypothetical protein